ncbi:MAG: transketolase [Erysipelotrichaceae bacterium]|nr:transketolase [Erysipelotrichaceae bacterium]
MRQTEKIANEMRKDIIEMIHAANSGHPGGSLSCVDIIASLFFEVMDIDIDSINSTDRDRFILSKGHASETLYAALAEMGIIPHEELLTFRKFGTRLQGHPNMNHCPGIDMSSGSLGQGLSVGVGMAIANKMNNKPYRVYVLVGDGECQEGMIWEAAMSASHYGLDNLVLIVDHNGLQSDGFVRDVMNNSPLGKKFDSFGWNVFGCDGHDISIITQALKMAKTVKDKPTVLIAETVKGKGVSFMENNPNWHGRGISDEDYIRAMKELGGDDCE